MLCDQIELEQHGSTLTIRVRWPQLDVPRMNELVETCRQRMRYHQATRFLFDLAAVEHLNSASLAPLIELLHDLEHVRGRIGLVHCQHHVASLFRLTRLDTLFNLYDDITHAQANI